MNERVTESLTCGSPSAGPARPGTEAAARRGSGRRGAPLRRAELFVLLGVRQRRGARRGTARGAAFDGLERAFSRIAAKLARTCIDLTMSSSSRVHRDLGRVLGDERVHRGGSLAKPCPRSPREQRRRVRSRGSAVSSVSTHFGLPTATAGLRGASQILRISAVGELDALEDRLLGDLVRASTIVSASLVPTTIRSSVDSRAASSDGLTANSSSMRAMRTAPTGRATAAARPSAPRRRR